MVDTLSIYDLLLPVKSGSFFGDTASDQLSLFPKFSIKKNS